MRILLSGITVSMVFLGGCSPVAPPSPPAADAGEGNEVGTTAPVTRPSATSPAEAAPPRSTSEGITEQAAASPPAPEKAPAAKDASPLTEGLENPGLVRAFENARQLAAENPTNVRSQLQYINILQRIGAEGVNRGKEEQGYRAFAAAADAAHQLVAAKAEIPGNGQQLLAFVFYNGACVASRERDAARAMASLEAAVDQGFRDFTTLESDADLAFVRETPEFAAKIGKWKEAAKALAARQAREELAAGNSFPFDFSLTDVTGKPIQLADYRGKVVIVDLWGTWCPPCRAEIPSFVQLQATYADKGFQMIGLNQEHGSEEEGTRLVQQFIAEQNMNYPCALVDEKTLNQVPNLEGFPTTLFIDRTGKVRLKAVGLHDYAFLEAVVVALLEEPVPAAQQALEK